MMWIRVSTQWRTAMNGAIGLDYGVFAWLFDVYEVKDRKDMFEGLQVMERAYLDCRARQEE